MPWEAIQYVSSGLTLVAFFAAIAAATYRLRLRREEELIKSAPEKQRAELIQTALEFFRIDSSKLTKQQQYDLALRQVRERARRFQTSAIVICFGCVVFLLATIYAINKYQSTKFDKNNNFGTIENGEDAQKFLEQVAK